MATIGNRSGQISWSRDFYALNIVGQSVEIKIVSLTFIQRFFRMVLGWYENTIWNQAKIDQIAKANAPQVEKIKTFVSNLNALRPLAQLKTEKFPLKPELRLRNILVVGKTRTGKSTAIQGLGDYTSIAPASSIFAKTEVPEVKDVEIIPGTVLHIVDTPGFFEVRSKEDVHKKRTNDQLTELTQKVVQEKFQGEGFQNVGRVVFTCTCQKIDQEAMETIFTYADLLNDGQEKILLITHTEGLQSHDLQSVKAQLLDSVQYGERLKKIFGENVFFIGALTQDIAELSEKQVMGRMGNTIIPRKEALLQRLVQGIVTDVESKKYCLDRRKAFESKKDVFLKSLEPYRKPAELRSLSNALERLLKGELQNQHIVPNEEQRKAFQAKLEAFIGSSDEYPQLKQFAELLRLFLGNNWDQLDAAVQDPCAVSDKWHKQNLEELIKKLNTYRMTKWLEQLKASEPSEAELLSFVEKARKGNFTPLFTVRYNVLLLHHYMKQNDVEKARPYADAVYNVFYRTSFPEEEKGELNQLLESCKQYEPFKKQIDESLEILNPK